MISHQPRILLIKLSAFGDVIHALPTLEALKEAFPGGQITWLVEAQFAPLLESHPALDAVWAVPRVRLGQKVSRRELLDLFQLCRRVRATPFDLVIDLQGLLKSALWTALAQSSRKVGYDRTRELSYLPLTERLPPYDREAHAVWRYLHVARYLGAPPTLPRFRLGLKPVLPESLYYLDRSLVVLHPGARWPTKLLPAASWAHLADWLIKEKGLGVVITGSAADRELAERVSGQMQEQALNLAGRTTLAELAGVMQQARLAITADTGPMHLAAALGTKVVAIFGPTAPGRSGPFGEGHRVVRLGLDCSPCFKRRCQEPRCLTELTPEAVQAAVEKSL